MRKEEKNACTTLLSVFLLGSIFVHGAADSELSVSTPDIIAACEGEDASFTWPCDLTYDLVKIMTLTFKGMSMKDHVVAAIDSTGRVNVSKDYTNRLTARGTSGVRLGSVGIVDSGTYLTTATFPNETVIQRQFTLNVLVPPLLIENELRMALTNSSQSCQRITCGRMLFPGFPALFFQWKAPEGTISHDASEGTSAILGCPLLPGNYTCQLIGAALTCGKRYPVPAAAGKTLSASLMLSAETGRAAMAADGDKDLLLMILIPIVAVMTPMVILGVWLLSHAMSGCSCQSNDSEAGSSSASALPPPVCRSTSSTAPPPPLAPVMTLLSAGAEDQGQGGEEDGADGGEEAASDEDIGDPTVPLMDPENLVASVALTDDSDDGDTRI